MMDGKGQITTAMAAAFAGLFIVGMIWFMCSPVVLKAWTSTENLMTEEEKATWGYDSTKEWAVFLWRSWPLFLVGAFVIYMFLTAQRSAYGGA